MALGETYSGSTVIIDLSLIKDIILLISGLLPARISAIENKTLPYIGGELSSPPQTLTLVE